MQTFDYIILGTGQATGTLLGELLPTGARIAIIEGDRVGGSCVNYGCTPTKALVASARVAYQARRSADFGITTGPVTVDYAAVRRRMHTIRTASKTGLTDWIDGSDQITLFRGWGTFEGPQTISVGEDVLHSKTIFINVGTRPRTPRLEGIADVPWLDSGRLLDLKVLPEHLVILGGGYIGLEFAQIYRRLGSQVTMLVRSEEIMPHEDRDIAEALHTILADEGITIQRNAHAMAVRTTETGGVAVTYTQGDARHEVVGSHFLVAIGREPNTERLGLDRAGIVTDNRGYITIDDYTRTNVPGVFALGDVNGRGAFTHTSVNDAEIVLDLLLQRGDRKVSDRTITYALFTDPPLGRVGLTERQAVEQGYQVLRATRPMSKISRAKEMSETHGFVKLLVDAETDFILGAAILGVHGDEVVNMFTALIYSDLQCRTYRKSVLVHPTVSELMPWTLDNLAPITA